MNSLLYWQENQQTHQARWLSDSRHPAPTKLIAKQQISADAALKLIHQQTAIIWRGDYHQGKQLLAAIKKRIRDKAKITPDFHRYRLQQLQHSRLFQMLLVVIEPNFKITNPRAPVIEQAMSEVFGTPNQEAILVPLHLLLGYIGAHEWHKKGVTIEALQQRKIHVPFGVFSPLRGEYLSLVATAPLPAKVHTGWDIGTGSGVLAAILAQRGVTQVIGTDTNLRAIACARTNIQQLGYTKQVTIMHTDLFPAEGKADLIVCNPPWLPTKASNDIEAALYDPQHTMLRLFLQQVRSRLQTNGQVWLIMSDLAEHLNLRTTDALLQWIDEAGLKVMNKIDTRPQHSKAMDSTNALAHARQQEVTSLWQLIARDNNEKH